MMTVQQLLSLTPRKIRQRTANPNIKKYKDQSAGYKKKEYRAVFTKTRLYNEHSTGSAYTLVIRNYGTSTQPLLRLFKPDTKVWVHCSCPFFMYHLEVALTVNHSSAIYDSNGAMPRITNPSLKPFLCKHLYATILMLLQVERNKVSP